MLESGPVGEYQHGFMNMSSHNNYHIVHLKFMFKSEPFNMNAANRGIPFSSMYLNSFSHLNQQQTTFVASHEGQCQ